MERGANCCATCVGASDLKILLQIDEEIDPTYGRTARFDDEGIGLD